MSLIFTGSAVGVRKIITLTPGGDPPNPSALSDATIRIGLAETKLLPDTFTGYDAEAIADAWALSVDPMFKEITALAGEDSIVFTHNTIGEDFEIVVLINGVASTLQAETQSITFANNATGGTFTLTFASQTTAAITYVPGVPATTVANILAALEALAAIQVGDVVVTSVSATVYKITFGGQYTGLNLDLITVDFANLTGGNATVTITQVQNGSLGSNETQKLEATGYDLVEETINEIQEISMTAVTTGGTFILAVPGYGFSEPLPYNLNRSGLRTAMAAMIGPGNCIVTGSQLPAGRLRVEFIGEFGGQNLPTMTVDSDDLTTSTTFNAAIETIRDGYLSSDPELTIATTQQGSTTSNTSVKNLDAQPPCSIPVHSINGQTDSSFAIGNISNHFGQIHIASGALADHTDLGQRWAAGGLLSPWTASGGPDSGQILRLKNTYPFASAPTGMRVKVYGSKVANNNWLRVSDVWNAANANLTTAFVQFTPKTAGASALLELDVTAIIQELWTSGDLQTTGLIRFIYKFEVAAGDIPANGFYSVTGSAAAADNQVVLAYTTGTSEKQTVEVSAAGGTFALTVDGSDTVDIAYNASNATLQAAIAAIVPGTLVTAGPLNSGNPVTVTFPYLEGNLAQMTVADNSLSGQIGVNELQRISLTNNPISGAVTITIDGNVFTALPYNATNLQVEAEIAEEYEGVACTGGPWPAAIDVEFPSGFGNIPQMTATDTLAGPPAVATVSEIQAGGVVVLGNIDGGSFGLGFSKPNDAVVYWVDDIPWNVSADLLEEMVNDVLGVGSVSCTGGPLPEDFITIAFANSWGTLNIDPTLIRPSLQGHFSGSSTNEVIRLAKKPVTVANCYDFIIIPGRGTLALNTEDDWTATTNQCNWGNFNLTLANGLRLVSDYFRWVDATPLDVENVINEMFGKDVCRVYTVQHSEEWAAIPNVYGGGTSERKIWYFKDVYRIVFHTDYVDPATIDDLEFVLPEIGGDPLTPLAFMRDTNTFRKDDKINESKRVLDAFVTADSIGTPIHDIRIIPGVVESQLLTFRFKFLENYVSGIYSEGNLDDGNSSNVARSVYSEFPADMKCRLTWRRRYREDTQEGSTDYDSQIIAQTALFDWDSPAHVIKTLLETMASATGDIYSINFFGEGNVYVEGGLRNSDLSEGYEAAEESDSYQDLRVTLINRLAQLPLDESEYFLQLDIDTGSSTHDSGPLAANTDGLQYNYPYAWSDIVSRPIPPLVSERQKVEVFNLGDEDTLSAGYNNIFTPVELDTTAQELEDALNALSTLGAYGTAAGFPPLPEKWRKSVTVYGSTIGDGPMEVEFNGYGFQYSDVLTVKYSVVPDEPLLVITTVADGSPILPEIQRIAVTGSPWAGQFKLTYSGQETAFLNRTATAGEVQAALIALSNIGPADVVCTGGPLFLDDSQATQGPITITFANNLGNLPAITLTANTLKNQKATIAEVRKGGNEGSLIVTETTRGNGPNFYDSPDNWRDVDTDERRVPTSLDVAIVDDARAAIKFGLRQKTKFAVLLVGASTKFTHIGGRRTFLSGSKVWVFTGGEVGDTLPAGLTAGYYYVRNSLPDGSFSLSLTPTGSLVQVTNSGSGNIYLQTRELTVKVYSRFAGGQIGLPRYRSTGNASLEYLAQYLEAGYKFIELGIDDGSGLSLGRFSTSDQNVADGVTVHLTGGSNIADIPAVLFLFDNEEIELTMVNGDVGISVYSDETSHLAHITHNDGNLFICNSTIDDGITTHNEALVKTKRSNINGIINP